jgi:hypothetical protein
MRAISEVLFLPRLLSTPDPSLARLMAPAIHFEGLLTDGNVTSFRDLAKLARVSTSRISQVMKLLDLAPSIQEQLLFAPVDTLWFGEVAMRKIASQIDWRVQEQEFRSVIRHISA